MPKNTFMKQFLSVVFILLFIPALALSQQGGKSVKEIATELKQTKDTKQRLKKFEELGKIKLKTVEDVQGMTDIVRSTDNENEKDAVLSLLKISEQDKHMEKEFINMLDDSDRDIRTAAIINLGTLKTKEAAPKLREILRDFNSIKYMEFKTLKYTNPKKAYKILYEPGVAAMALGDMKDDEAIPIIVEKFDHLEQFGADALSNMGTKGLPHLLELARKEAGSKNHYAEYALADIKDIEAKPDLLTILITEKNRDIRDSILLGLRRHMFDAEVLSLTKRLYDEEKDVLFLSAMRTKEAIPFLINVLKNEREQPHNRQYVVSILEDIRDPSVIPVLEEALKEKRDLNIRSRAVNALIIIGDTETLIRLRDYLKSNLGTVVNVEYDNAQLKLIEKRLKSGRRGSIIFDEFEEQR